MLFRPKTFDRSIQCQVFHRFQSLTEKADFLLLYFISFFLNFFFCKSFQFRSVLLITTASWNKHIVCVLCVARVPTVRAVIVFHCDKEAPPLFSVWGWQLEAQAARRPHPALQAKPLNHSSRYDKVGEPLCFADTKTNMDNNVIRWNSLKTDKGREKCHWFHSCNICNSTFC